MLLMQTYSQFKLVGQHFFMSEWDYFHIAESAGYKTARKSYLNPHQSKSYVNPRQSARHE
jgi:hypothetical protein